MLQEDVKARMGRFVYQMLMTFPTPFLNEIELNVLEYVALCVQKRCVQNVAVANYEVAEVIIKFITYFRRQRPCRIDFLQHFCLWMRCFLKGGMLSCWEYSVTSKMFLQCKWFIIEKASFLPEEQYGKDTFMFGERIKKLKNIRFELLRNGRDPTYHVFRKNPALYNDLRNAYTEGRQLLRYPDNIRALSDVMTASRISPAHEEFAITGTHTRQIHKNSVGMTRGFDKGNGVKSVQPVYSNGENTLFHSHPSLSPISYNPRQDVYTQKTFPGGDMAHAYVANKNIFAINSEGDIFYTNPELASSCIESYKDCELEHGQIYLGNIREFKK